MKNILISVTLVILFAPLSAPASPIITGEQTAANEWTYNLTFAPLDNVKESMLSAPPRWTCFGAVACGGALSIDSRWTEPRTGPLWGFYGNN